VKGNIYIIGLGPGKLGNMTTKAIETIKSCEVIAGYKVYIEQIRELIHNKKIICNGMGKEILRCELAIEEASQGKMVGLVCSGDAGPYGMAGLVLELINKKNIQNVEIEIIPGITAAISCSSLLGAPIVEDFCTISLSDYMTPYNKILKRIELAAKGEFIIAIYNPRSSKRQDYLSEAINIIRKEREDDTPVGIVRMAYREEQSIIRTTISNVEIENVDMFCTIIVGNKQTKWINNYMVTSRGYKI
jgi:precorrin-3B C17-methyltransferase